MNDNKKMNSDKRILDFDRPLDYKLMMEYLNVFAERYDFISVTYLCPSILGKNIPVIKLGEGKESVLYVGSHHGAEWMSSVILVKFINEYCELYRTKKSPFGVDLGDTGKSIYVIPMLNPDGVDISIHGVDEDNIMYDRLFSMNGKNKDFTTWKANARGVDLNHNYNAGFLEYKAIEAAAGIYGGAPTRYSGECAESEPEVGALCNFLRFNDDIKMVLTFHTQGEEIYYSSGDACLPRSKETALYFSRLCGYAVGKADGMAAYGGLTDWMIRELARPSFTIECGKGETPLPLSDHFLIYNALRELLFKAPLVRV